jgi:hypothetical protein
MKSVTQNVKSDKLQESDLSQRRFGTILLLFKLAGIPLNTHSVSGARSVYSVTTAACHYFTCVSCFMDVYVNRNDFEELVKSIRLCLSMTFVTVLDIFFRYLKLTSTLLNYILIYFKVCWIEVLTEGTVKIIVHWNSMSCSPVANRFFGGTSWSKTKPRKQANR